MYKVSTYVYIYRYTTAHLYPRRMFFQDSQLTPISDSCRLIHCSRISKPLGQPLRPRENFFTHHILKCFDFCVSAAVLPGCCHHNALAEIYSIHRCNRTTTYWTLSAIELIFAARAYATVVTRHALKRRSIT